MRTRVGGVTGALSEAKFSEVLPQGVCEYDHACFALRSCVAVPIYKPRMVNSNRCLLRLKLALGLPTQRKVGGRHLRMGQGGTLDPMAAGVLVVGIGDGCIDLQEFLLGSKIYVVKGQLGASTPSLDLSTPCTVVSDWRNVTKEDMLAVLPRFRGEILQEVPMFSAKRLNGERLYTKAWRGEDVERDNKRLTVYNLDLIGWEPPYFTLQVESSSGFYVRQLVQDIGTDLKCGALAFSITRTRHGPFEVKDALREEEWDREHVAQKMMWARDKYRRASRNGAHFKH